MCDLHGYSKSNFVGFRDHQLTSVQILPELEEQVGSIC